MSTDYLWEKTFDNFKKITPAMVAIAILSGLILFLPEDILKKMSLNDLPERWKQIIGIVFLLSIALIGALLLFSFLSHIMSKNKNIRLKKNLKDKIKTLSPRQKVIIKQLLRSEDKTISLDKNSGDTIYLLNNLFLYMPQQVASVGRNNEIILTYTPQPWLLELYNEEPDLFN